MSFELIVLGANGTFPTDQGATTGFLLRADGAAIWIDAGTGTFGNLQRYVSFFEIDALVLSHLHLDHIMDVYPLYYALRYSPDTKGPIGLPVYAPPGAEAFLGRILSDEGCDFDGYLKFTDLQAGDKIELGPFRFGFVKSRHPIETMAMRIETETGSLAYTSDSAPSDDLVELARGVDLLVAEASLQQPVEKLAEVHMTAEEAGQLAAKADVGRLVLTHLTPGLDPKISIKQAARHYPGEILLAADNVRFEVGA